MRLERKELVQILEDHSEGRISRETMIRRILEMSPPRSLVIPYVVKKIFQSVVHTILMVEHPNSRDVGHWSKEIDGYIGSIRSHSRKHGKPIKLTYHKSDLWFDKSDIEEMITLTLQDQPDLDKDVKSHGIRERKVTKGWSSHEDIEEFFSFEKIFPEFKKGEK